MNILAIAAHQDEVESQVGGTLAKYAKDRRNKIFIATATNGNKGNDKMSMEKTALVRKEEAKNAAAIIGAEYICLDFEDEMFFDGEETRLKFLNLARYCKADIIFTHNPCDYSPDDVLTSKMVRDISTLIPLVKIKTESPPYKKIPALFYFEPYLGLGFLPTDYVDITDFYDTKIAMCHKHVSQIQRQRDFRSETYGKSTEDSYDTLHYIARFRGLQCGVIYAEAFIYDYTPDRIRPFRILP